MGLRIVGGRLGGRLLKAPHGSATRPTSDRVREAVFNMLLARGEPPARVLDLYAGTGAMALEALSRGAARAVCVEAHGPTARLLADNARALGVEAQLTVQAQRVLDWLRRAAPVGDDRFGWVFLDPPYADAARELPAALTLLAERGLLADGAIVVAEHDARTTLEAPPTFAPLGRRPYGQTAVTLWLFNITESHENGPG